MSDSQEVVIAKIQKDIEFIKENSKTMGDGFTALRKEFSDYLDKEALRWQRWSEVHSMAQEAKNGVEKLEKSFENYVTREEFALIQRIVYGAITVVLLAVLGSVVYNALKNYHSLR